MKTFHVDSCSVNQILGIVLALLINKASMCLQLIRPTCKCNKYNVGYGTLWYKKTLSVTHSNRMVDMKTLNKYKCVLASFMSFIHGRSPGDKYGRNYIHSVGAMAAVTL
jgi:hypothetical protein